jgi:hypothetical protein
MPSITDVKPESILSSDGKYHLILIYLFDDDGIYGVGYYAKHFKFIGGVEGESLAEMKDQAYDFLEEHLEDEKDLPFDIKNIKESVVFDLVECLTPEEQLAALDLRRNGATYEEIKEGVQE